MKACRCALLPAPCYACQLGHLKEALTWLEKAYAMGIAEAIKTITADDGLRAELARRGRTQAALFSVARYRERVAALYEKLR